MSNHATSLNCSVKKSREFLVIYAIRLFSFFHMVFPYGPYHAASPVINGSSDSFSEHQPHWWVAKKRHVSYFRSSRAKNNHAYILISQHLARCVLTLMLERDLRESETATWVSCMTLEEWGEEVHSGGINANAPSTHTPLPPPSIL